MLTTRNNPCPFCEIQEKSIFGNHDACLKTNLAQNKIENAYQKGQAIYLQDNPLFGVYCVTEGHVKLVKKAYDGQEVITKLANPGDFIGLQGLFSPGQASHSAIAIEDTVVSFIEKDVIRDSISKSPDLFFNLTKQLNDTVETEELRVLGLSRKSVRERVAETLLTLARSYGIRKVHHDDLSTFISLKLTREELSSLSGTAVETLIRCLSDYKEEELVRVEGRDIQILNIKGLEDIAGMPHLEHAEYITNSTDHEKMGPFEQNQFMG